MANKYHGNQGRLPGGLQESSGRAAETHARAVSAAERGGYSLNPEGYVRGHQEGQNIRKRKKKK